MCSPASSQFRASSLGFASVKCTACPCPAWPLVHVVMCFAVNSQTQVCIEEGCSFPQVSIPPTTCDLAVSYTPAITEDSWGRLLRTFTFDRSLQRNRFLRVTFSSTGCGAGCDAPLVPLDGSAANNAILGFTVDGVSRLESVRAVLIPAGAEGVGCSSATCIPGSCCAQSEADIDVTAILPGTQFVFGPLGNLPF